MKAWINDYYQYSDKKYNIFRDFKYRILYREYMWIVLFRKCKINNIFYLWNKLCFRRLSKKLLLDIPSSTKIGPGLKFGHASSIVINSNCDIGNNFQIFKGALVGSIVSGKKAGVPKIGNNCVICANAVVVGNITIGNNVFIAANSFVNFDVPDNSIVIGNPGIIKKCSENHNPVFDYIKCL